MDSTPNPTLTPHNHNHNHNRSIKASASKLPIKRKTHPDSSSSKPNANPSFSPILVAKLEPPTTADDGGGDEDDDGDGGGDRNPSPFKFHRIWTEPDEIRFLQGLLDCSSNGLSFPRDLGVFYARFSDTMSQPYTKSQLSEKLRRLRKKFRVISLRLVRGLDEALLSPHDRALFDLSKQLWHQDFSSTSPFGAGNKQKKSNLVGVKVRFSPTLPSASIPVSNQPMTHELIDHDALNNIDNNDCNEDDDHVVGGFDVDGDVKLSEVNIEFDGGGRKQESSMPSGSNSDGGVGCDLGGRMGQVMAKTVISVFDQSLKEVRMALVSQGLLYSDQRSAQASSSKEGKVDDFETRWREQRVAEMDVLARRLRLVLEHSVQRQ